MASYAGDYDCFSCRRVRVPRKDSLCAGCKRTQAVSVVKRCEKCGQRQRVKRPRGPPPNELQMVNDEIRALRLMQRRLDDELWTVTELGVVVEEDYSAKLASQRLQLTAAIERASESKRKLEAEKKKGKKMSNDEYTEVCILWLEGGDVADDKKRQAVARLLGALGEPLVKAV